MTFLFGRPIFRGYVSFREGNPSCFWQYDFVSIVFWCWPGTLRFWDDDLVDLELFQMDDWNHNSPWYFPVRPRFALILAEICYGNTKWMDFSMFSLQITGWSKGILQDKFLKIHERLVIWANYIEMAPWDKWYPVVTVGCSNPTFLDGLVKEIFKAHDVDFVWFYCPKWEKPI